ncbi:hypothetical protein [Streptomyces eurythermus]
MKYIDRGGDTWETVAPGYIRVVVMRGADTPDSEPWDVDVVEEKWGPLRPLVESADAVKPDIPTVESVMSRGDIYRAAHALVAGLAWGESEKPSVYDVLQVAKWLEGDA